MHSLTQLNDLSNQTFTYNDQALGSVTAENKYRFNGLIDTGQNVFNNLELLANSAATWLSFDQQTGKWDLILNKPEVAIGTFDDTNILGTIQLTTTGLTESYNAVEVKFPHSDLNGQMDVIRIGIPEADRLQNESDHVLNIQYDLVTDAVQAQYLGLVELKQSRLDKVIVFGCDYTYINMFAGAVIEVSSTLYGWDKKLFRIVAVQEKTDDGGLFSEITALEYDPNLYSTADLYKYTRTTVDGLLNIGAIGTPETPEVTKYESDARPRVEIEAFAPSGIVNGVEFYITYDTDATFVVDSDRSYRFLDSRFAANGTNFEVGQSVILDVDNLNSSNFLIKVRGLNGSSSGPWSEPSGLVEFIPEQVTQAIATQTQIKDQTPEESATDGIGGLLAANGLLLLLRSLMGNRDSSSKSIYSQLFGLLGDNTGNNIASGNAVGRVSTSDAARAAGLTVNYLGQSHWQIDLGGKSTNMPGDGTTKYAVITWTFVDGLDLDIRCILTSPFGGQDTVDKAVGWTGATSTTQWPETTPILKWAGDNTGTGTEQVLVDFDAMDYWIPDAVNVYIGCYGNWYGEMGPTAVKLTATLYQGGTATDSGTSWTVTGASYARNIAGLDVFINSEGTAETIPGDLMGYFVYNRQTKEAKFTNTIYI